MIYRWGILCTVTLILAWSAQVLALDAKIDKVEVFKAERRVELITMTKNGPQTVKSYDMSLGFEPLGHKTQEGDGKTPEGLYTLDWKNANSKYHLSIRVSYPNQADRDQARDRGVSPGGEIFIHGMPNNTKPWAWLISPAFNGSVNEMIHSILQDFDWTLGCVAFRNKDIEEIYKAIKIPTPIEIFP
jgi:murein L,D-transpeptidase YafK